ncbi:Nif3-like dinuclear metal center hexameric protein [uncultured Corynebacterium sp.]|uniref:Nif3-like dinuclear metal center hexameric protein n=1 Tax=uncultured Corynebacterium sp. TaxID=159447 RepID=UPI0025D3AFAD|nr:Nif3-like dinuclear metal center hexameric protein [uncultured Corynebacterium sp.]
MNDHVNNPAPSTAPATVGDVVSLIEQAYPPRLAESWDACGLVCGDPADIVRTVRVALDCTDAVADAAVADGADLLLVHHPPLLRGVTGVPVTHPKGRIIHRLIRAGVALYAAHTSADAARPGVNDRLAELLGVTPGVPLTPVPDGVDPLTATGIGRVGDLDTPMTLREFTARVADRLPATVWGVRAAGDPDRMIRRVAVASGAGDSFLSVVAGLDVDCFVTSDLRHHPVDEHLRAGGCPVVDTAHWASEFPWCSQAADLLAVSDPRLDTGVIDVRTDPWTLHCASAPTGRTRS